MAVLDREAIVASLREIASLLALQGANKHKVRAFERGARSLEASRDDIERLLESGRLAELPGIGPALVHQIGELHRTGKSELLDSLRQGLPSGVLELAQISGIGLHALRALHDELGIGTVDDLRDAARTGKLRALPGFGEEKETRILRAIERYETKAPTIALSHGLELADAFEHELLSLDGVESVHLGGALRRYMELSDDIVLVAVSDAPAHVLARVATMSRVASTERSDDRQWRLRLVDGTRMSLFVCTAAERPTLVAWATGTPNHWAKLVDRANERGYRLTPRGLYTAGDALVPLSDDDELFRRLGLSWIPPEMREDLGEVELAADAKHFDLVERADIRGFVHCHTTWSDGKSGIEEMARAAEALGASFITITDHSPAAHYAGGLDIDRLARQWDEIAEVQERVSVRILRGSEVDILADGALDLPDAVLEKLEVVIASIHNRFRQDEDAMTERVVRALRHPSFKIWGHPLGRLVSSRPPIPLRVEEVLDAFAESRGAIEISGDPKRLDLEPRWVRAARERHIPFVLSVDAHSMTSLANLHYAVGLARRAGVEKSEVLNARSAESFARAVRPI